MPSLTQVITALVISAMTLVFGIPAAIMFASAAEGHASPEPYWVMAGQGVVAVLVCAVATAGLMFLSKHWTNIIHAGYTATADVDRLTVHARYRLTGKQVTYYTIDMTDVRYVDFEVNIFSPNSYLVFWDRDPRAEFTFVGTKPTNEEAKIVGQYSLNAILDNPRLATAFGDALTSYELADQFSSEIDFHTWTHQPPVMADGVTLHGNTVAWQPGEQSSDTTE